MRLTSSLLTLFLVAGCADPGDFCDVVKAPLDFDPNTAAQIVETDREDAERIAVQNEYGDRHCTW